MDFFAKEYGRVFTFAGGTLGIFGIAALGIFLLMYLSDFDSYGGAYFAPIAPLVEKDLKDSIIRSHLTKIKSDHSLERDGIQKKRLT